MTSKTDDFGTGRKRYTYGEDEGSVEFEFGMTDLYDKVESLGQLSDEAVFEFKPDEIRAKIVDPAVVATCEVTSNGTSGADSTIVEVGFNIQEFLEAMSSFAWTDGRLRMEVPLETNDPRDAQVEVASFDADQTETVYQLSPDNVHDVPDLDDIESPYEFSVDAWKLKGMISGVAEAAHNAVRLNPKNGEIHIAGDGGPDSWDEPWQFDDSDLEWGFVIPELEDEEPAYFSADYLVDILAGLPADEVATVRFGPEAPLQITAGGVQYHQAHRKHGEDWTKEDIQR